MTSDVFLFWFLSIVTIVSGLAVVLLTNPIFCALSLVMTMVGIAGLFVTLNAYFLAGVQLIVYAGAVMVLFVMVLMLFDLRQETKPFAKGQLTGFLKIASVGVITGLIAGAVYMSRELIITPQEKVFSDAGIETTKQIGLLLFSKYVFSFEILGVLLLVIAVGAVALARSKGGTHGQHE